MKGRIAYLCLEAVREGRASYAHVNEIIKGLRRRGWNIELFEPLYDKKKDIPNLLVKLLAFITIQFRLFRKLRDVKALYIRSHPATFLTVAWCRIRGVPVILEVNGPYDDLFLAYPWTTVFKIFFKSLMKTQFAMATAIIVVTNQLREWIQKEVGQKAVYVIPNGANTELFHPNAHLHILVPKPYVVFFGALTRWQGIEILLQAINSKEWPKEVNLVIVGDGVEKPLVEEACKQNKRLVYMGKIPYNEIAGVVAFSIAGLSPQNNLHGRSNTGLSPLKVFETLACGIPVIVTDFPGQADLVRSHNCGLVIPAEDSDALAKAVAYIYSHMEVSKEMGKRGRKVVESEHSWDRRAAETGEVIGAFLN